MAFGRKQPDFTGADYIIGLASDQAERGKPWADAFSMMAQSAVMGSGPYPPNLLETVAQRPLKEHEAMPVSIILAAFQAANERRDHESIQEVLMFGMSLLAKWPEFLASTTTGHPTLDFKPVEEWPEPEEDGDG